MKRSFFAVCAVLAAAFLVVACGQKNSAQSAPSDSGVTTLRILAGQSTTDAGIETMIDAALAKKYPEIKLEWECVGWGTDFTQKVQMYIQSGLPDILIGKGQDVATYAPQGLLGDMTGKAYLNEVFDAAKDGVTIDGKIYGLVYNALYQGVYYNRELFSKYNAQIPTTLDELNALIALFESNGITPFATHFVDTWSIGNIAMQFAVNDVFNKNPVWGDDFRAGKVDFATSPEYRACYEYCKLIYDNSWSDETFSMEQTACDARMVLGQAAMKVSGSWSIQNFLDIDESFNFGVFPFPNQTGDAKLLFEPNITFMKSATSTQQDAIDKVFEVIATDKDLALEIVNFTKTASMLQGVTPTYPNPSQTDIDSYAARGMIQDVNLGNNQLQWGGFQDENAKEIAEYMQGKITVEQALAAADSRRANSKAQ